MKKAADKIAILKVSLRGSMDTALTQKDVFIMASNAKPNATFIEKLKADIIANSDKYGPSAQKIGNANIVVVPVATALTDSVGVSIQRYVEKYKTSVADGGWNL